ncbi:tRNA-dihydrouridine synthase [Candidatus Saccharibacteria bacterium]|nr:tRNA-dihydrouridine synthase [Candidatus Saccharibacteria bacterium]
MSNIWDSSTKPLFVLAPMDDVTDCVFRSVVEECASPDVYFTEFVNVDGLQSPGRQKLLHKLKLYPAEKRVIAQLWGLNPENFHKTAAELADMGFAGIDLNMGCPAKSEVKNGACSALINNRPLAVDIIRATQAGAGDLPVSVKTRLGFSSIDLTWHELLLEQNLDALTVHWRTRKEMSKVPAHWEYAEQIVEMRDKLSPQTKIIGNGDVLTRQQGLELVEQYGIDGIMIGRGVFQDPYVFAIDSPWQALSPDQKIALYRTHVQRFADAWQANERKVVTLNKFCKVYVNGFDGAKELRERLMAAGSTDELLSILG